MAIDIEITNRCNARCRFCPRDLTPHEGLVSPDVLDESLRQAIAYRLLPRGTFFRLMPSPTST